MTESGVRRRLFAWSGLVGLLALLNFSANLSDGKAPNDLLFRYETAVVGFLFYTLMLGLVLVIASGFDPRESFALRRPRSWGVSIGLAAGLVVVMLTVAALLEPVFGAGKEQGLDPPGWEAHRAVPFVLNAFVVAVFGPFVEELLFRGIGFFLLAEFGQVVAIVVTASAFALTHGIVQGLPIFFIIGAGLGFLRSRTGSLYPAFLLHAGFNGIGVVAGLFN
jgi:membrane protease YdiL (CAAX protease family)